jgi:hypothetical protein
MYSLSRSFWIVPADGGRRIDALLLGDELVTERLGDDGLHHLVGPAVDGRDAGVGVGAGDRVLQHVAVPTEQLEAAVDGGLLEVGAPVLRLGGVGRRQLTGVELQHALVDVRLGDVDLGLHLGEYELRVLERADRLAERRPLLHVLDGPVECRLGGGLAGHGDREALLGEVAREVVEPLALVAEQVRDGHADVVEEQLGRVLAVHADLVEVAAALETGHVALDDQE